MGPHGRCGGVSLLPLQVVLPWLVQSDKVHEQTRILGAISRILRFICNFTELAVSAWDTRGSAGVPGGRPQHLGPAAPVSSKQADISQPGWRACPGSQGWAPAAPTGQRPWGSGRPSPLGADLEGPFASTVWSW